MSTTSVAPPPQEQPSVAVERWRRALAAGALAAVVALALLRSVTRRLRARRDRENRSLALREVIVVYPAEAWRDGWQAAAVAAVFRLVERRMRRWDARVRYERSIARKHLPGLGRTYVRLQTAQGAEDDTVRAINVAAWRFGLPRGRRGVLAVRAPLIVPAAQVDPPGPVTFTKAYADAKARIGVAGNSAQGVKILVVDVDRPAAEFLPSTADVKILDPADQEIRNGHATAITAIVADIAAGATITTRSIHDEQPAEGFWSLLDIVASEQDADVIVASVSAPEGGSSKDGRGRDNVFEFMFRFRVPFPNYAPILFPTGNAQGSSAMISTMAIPARFESVIAIGACDEYGRSAGSRYGAKQGGDSFTWWLAPGGSFDGVSISTPLADMGGNPVAGTSIANAIAGGLVACAIRKLREQEPPPDAQFDAAMDVVRSRLQARPGALRSLALADALSAAHRGRLITLASLIDELKTLSHPEHITGYNLLEHGRGLLCLESPA